MAVLPTIVVHNLDHARAALKASAALNLPVRLMSAKGAAGYAGCGWFKAMIEDARRRHPDAESEAVLDCGNEAGLALGAIRSGVEAISIRLPVRSFEKIAAIAKAAGVKMEAPPGRRKGQVLDLLDAADPFATVLEWMGGVEGRK